MKKSHISLAWLKAILPSQGQSLGRVIGLVQLECQVSVQTRDCIILTRSLFLMSFYYYSNMKSTLSIIALKPFCLYLLGNILLCGRTALSIMCTVLPLATILSSLWMPPKGQGLRDPIISLEFQMRYELKKFTSLFSLPVFIFS